MMRNICVAFFNMGQPWPLFNLFSVFFQTNIITVFTTNKFENVHPVYGAGIRTHNLLDVSLLLLPLDQGSHPSSFTVCHYLFDNKFYTKL